MAWLLLATCTLCSFPWTTWCTQSTFRAPFCFCLCFTSLPELKSKPPMGCQVAGDSRQLVGDTVPLFTASRIRSPPSKPPILQECLETAQYAKVTFILVQWESLRIHFLFIILSQLTSLPRENRKCQ